MLIRHKIILLFIVFSGLLLCLFSVYIYLASANSRNNSFFERIKNKALATREIYELNDKVAEKIIISIPEQSEYVFDERDKLIFSINDMHDFKFDKEFFSKIEKRGEDSFSYKSSLTGDTKDGYAFVFKKGNLKRTIVITAFNKSGFDSLKSLGFILVVGNLFFLVAVGLVAYVFAFYTFKPVNDLVAQAESVSGHDLNFRLTYANPSDEIGIVATSFNKLLSRIQGLIESQKSFISYASHELRTPLAAIHGILETSINYDKDQDAARSSLDAARKEIQKATSLVNGLLQLAKIDSADKVVERSRINIVDVLLDAISFYKTKRPSQEFLFDIPETKDNETSIEMYGHAQLLRTAFTNLIDNASKYSHQQKIEIKLDIESSKFIKIKIIDRGIGIPLEDGTQVFEPFYRAKNVIGYEGFGLGLALTKRIFDLHEGNIKLSKNEFSGVTAEIILPAILSQNV